MKKSVLYKNEYIVTYTDAGNPHGFPILVQHGLIASIEDYDLFDSLAVMGARLISIARPGYGESSPYTLQNVAEWGDMVAVLVDRLHISQFDVLGMSSGAPYSYSLGCKFTSQARNIFIFSGIPALYDEKVVAHWPYEVKKDAPIAEMQKLAYDLFFSSLSPEDLSKRDIHDTMMNNCFGPGLDFRIRGMDWGFTLSEVHQPVYMQHSRQDEGFIPAEITSQLLPNCKFIPRESAGHFSKELLDEFIRSVMAGFYSLGQ